MPADAAARKARVARGLRRAFALPFWALLTLCIVSWPAGSLCPTTGWYLARFLSPVLLIPVTLIRALPTTRVIGFSHYKNDHLRRRPGCLVAFGLFAGVFLLDGAASCLAPALVATTPANAQVTKCTTGKGGPNHYSVTCEGNWTVNGVRETGQGLPVVGRPGTTVRIRVSRLSPDTAYGELSGSRAAMGVAFAVGGVLLTGAGLYLLVAPRDRIRRALDDVIAGRATVPARVLNGHGPPART